MAKTLPLTGKTLTHRTFAEFFAGIGLMRIGLEKAGWSIGFANDIDEDKRDMYRAQFADADEHFVLDDIHKLNPDNIPTVTLATASFPCNDLSLAGMRKERTDYLINQMSERHFEELNEMKAKRTWSYGTVFRRVRNGRSMAELRTDGVAGCLRTPRGGSGRQILVQAGYGKVKARLLTPRECARLMGANGFRIQASLNRALFGFGDAVCVPVITWLANHYINPVVEDMASALAQRSKRRKRVSA